MAESHPKQQKRQAITRRQWAAAGVVVLCAALMALLFFSGLSLAPFGRARQQVNLAEAHGEGFHFAQDGSLVMRSEGGWVSFGGLDAATANLRVSYHAAAQRAFPVPVSLALTGDDAYADGEFLADEALFAPKAKPGAQTLLLHSNGNLHGFSLTFAAAKSEWVITAITLNGGGFAFNWAIFLLLALGGLVVWCVVVLRLYLIIYNDENRRHRWLARGAAALCALALVAVCLMGMEPGRRGIAWKYDPALLPEEQVDEYPGTAFYHLLFDAFRHGQTALRVTPDSALAELDNPYDRSQRGDIPTLWDTSYYNGRYYSYFGPGPMPFYFAFNLLTGHLPSPAVACLVPGVLLAFLLWGALRQLLLYYSVKPNLILLLLSIPALMFGGLTAMLVSCADAYAQPYLWANVGLCGMVALLHAATMQKRSLWARLCYAGAGLCVVLVAASRPGMLLVCLAFALPPLWHMLRANGAKTGDKMWNIAAIGLPVAAGAARLMAYNAVRFGSPLDFGQAYQLTVGDMRLQPFRWQPAWLLEAARYFLFQPLQLTQPFPFHQLQSQYPLLFGNRFYSDPFFGLLNLPLYWLLALGPVVMWNGRKNTSLANENTYSGKNAVFSATFIAVLCAGLFVFWYDFSVGNFLYRYLCDASFAWALLAVLLMLWCVKNPAGDAPAAGRGTFAKAGAVGACAVCLASIVLGLLLAFSNDRHTVYLNNPQWLVLLDNIFRIR